MKRNLLFIILPLMILIPSSNAFTFEGPLQVKNQLPLFMYVNAPYLETARIENSFSVSLSHSSVYLVEESTEWYIGLDMEVTELNLRLKKIIKDFLEVGVDIPIVSFNSGFMDSFINSFHEVFDLRDYGRSNRPDDAFLYDVSTGGIRVLDAKGGNITIGDIRMSLKKPILIGDPAISIKGDLEFPTGDAKGGYGNGGIDAGIAVLFDKELSEKFKGYCNLGAVFPGDLKGNETIELEEFVYIGAGIESCLWKKLGLVGQVLIQGSPYPGTDIAEIDRTSVLLSFGGRYLFGRNSLEISLTEDPSISGAPDFTLNVTFKRRF